VSAAPSGARAVAAAVADPEMPFLTLADLGVLRDVVVGQSGTVVTVTPTYSGCPAITEMKRDLHRNLTAAGYGPVEIRTALSPPWSSDWITAEGRQKLRAAGIEPPLPRHDGSVAVRVIAKREQVACPRCGSPTTVEISHFGPTPCTALRRCQACDEPFQHVKAI
jgi:ring-1,2-phenylacetyl-CoA epoxidase subunit PaaD